MSELTITLQSTARVLRHHNAQPTTKRAATKVNGKMIAAFCAMHPTDCYFDNRSFFGGGETFTYLDLKARGVKSILVRCNQDRDVLMIKVM